MDFERREVLGLGLSLDAPLVQELENRRCVVHIARIDDPKTSIAPLRAAVVLLPAVGFEPYCDWVACNARSLIDYGVRLKLLSPDDATLGHVQSCVPEALKVPHVHTRAAPPAAAVAEGIARHSAGMRPRLDLKIVVADDREPIRKNDRPLFFAKCSEVTLVELTGADPTRASSRCTWSWTDRMRAFGRSCRSSSWTAATRSSVSIRTTANMPTASFLSV